MKLATSLKLGASAFTALWIGWMLWWSGSFDRVTIIMLASCGAAAGYGWYRAMRWQFQRSGLLPRNHPAEPTTKR